MTPTLTQVQRSLATWEPKADPVLMSPERSETGYWVGCASVLVEPDRVLVTFRRRRPRGVGAERGWQIGIAAFDPDLNPTSQREVLTIHKDELSTASMERSCLVSAEGGYEFYISYVDPADNRWRVDVLAARTVEQLSVSNRRAVFTATQLGNEGVKDPRVVVTDQRQFMLLSVAEAKTAGGADPGAHATQDIYNTDHARSLTGLAQRDGPGWRYLGPVLTPSEAGWDANVTRLGSVLPINEGYLGFYDGERSWRNNYEELAGLAYSADLRDWKRLTVHGPYVRGGGATDSVRYIDAVSVRGVTHLFYEYTRPDGSHDLRVHKLEV